MPYLNLDRCPICASTRVTDNHMTGCAPRFQVDLAPGFQVWAGCLAIYSRCDDCGVLYQNPRMDDAQVAQYYADGIYRATLNMTDERMDADEAHRAQVDAKIIHDNFPYSFYSHLDIGASRGYLLQAIGAARKWAVEPTLGRILFRDIHEVRSLDEVDSPPSFNLVTLIHALEHEPHPVEYLRKIRDVWMNVGPGEGGFPTEPALVVEVPSWQSPGGPMRLAHLYHWAGADEFAVTARLAGLKIVKHLTTPHNLFILERSQE